MSNTAISEPFQQGGVERPGAPWFRLVFMVYGILVLVPTVVGDSGDRTAVSSVRSIRLGSNTIDLLAKRFGDTPYLFCNVHDDEDTSVMAAMEILPVRGGRLVELRHRGDRNVKFELSGSGFEFDPNRIFTSAGVRRTLANLSQWSDSAQQALETFAEELLEFYSLESVDVVVALHNNTEGRYAATNYLKGQDLEQDAAEVHLVADSDHDDFFFVTEKWLFDALRSREFNVVLQDNEGVTDDGSLSVYCGKSNIPYVNVEAQHGHLDQQRTMISALIDVLERQQRSLPAASTVE